MSINQSKKRLSVSPIISTYSFYNKLNLNSPNINVNNQSFTTTTTTTTTTTATSSSGGQTTTSSILASQTSNPAGTSSTLVTAHQHFLQRNFSPMATLSRSPSCSSSPAAISSIRRAAISNNQLAVNSANAQASGNLLQVTSVSNRIR
jgi:hypothetical protein